MQFNDNNFTQAYVFSRYHFMDSNKFTLERGNVVNGVNFLKCLELLGLYHQYTIETLWFQHIYNYQLLLEVDIEI